MISGKLFRQTLDKFLKAPVAQDARYKYAYLMDNFLTSKI